MTEMRTENAVLSQTLRKDAIIQTDEYQILAQIPLPSVPDAVALASSPGINLTENQTRRPFPAASNYGHLATPAEGPSSEDHHQEPIVVAKRPRGRPRGTVLPPQELILPMGAKRLRTSKNI